MLLDEWNWDAAKKYEKKNEEKGKEEVINIGRMRIVLVLLLLDEGEAEDKIRRLTKLSIEKIKELKSAG